MVKILLMSLGLLFTGCVNGSYDSGKFIEKELTTQDKKNISQINITLEDGVQLPKEYINELNSILKESKDNLNEKRELKLTNISNEQLNIIVKNIEQLNTKHKLTTNLTYREINTIEENKYSYFIDNYITDIVISNR